MLSMFITEGNEPWCVLTALVWQLMKAYTLSILTKLAGQEAGHPVVEREIVAWANEKVCISWCIFSVLQGCQRGQEILRQRPDAAKPRQEKNREADARDVAW